MFTKFSVFNVRLTETIVRYRNYLHTGQYHFDRGNSNSFYKVLLNKLNAIRFNISFITAL